MARSTRRPALRQEALGAYVRRLREESGLSVRALAARTDFSPSLISQLEHGIVSPSIHSLGKIAGALGVTLGALFSALGPGEGGLVMRRRERRSLGSSWSRASIESLARASPRRRLEPLLITLRAGGRSGKHPAPQANEQFAFVLRGRVTLRMGPDEHRLGRGDSATLLPRELTLWINESRGTCEILLVGLQP